MGKPGKVPRPFTMPWGGGQVVEEVGVDTEYNELVVQLLRYDDDADGGGGGDAVRFCQYWLDGRFQRQPMLLGEESIDALREALKGAPAIRSVLQRLVAD